MSQALCILVAIVGQIFVFVVGAPEGGCSSEGLEPLKPSDVEEMTKCEHGHRHDTDGNTFDEHGKLLHGGAGGAKTESNSDARNTKDAKEMEKCKHGNYHDKDGTVYDETGKKIHGPGGSHEQGVKTGHGQGEGADEEGADSWDSYESYQTMFNLLGASAPKLVTAVDLSAHKSAVDLGGACASLRLFLCCANFDAVPQWTKLPVSCTVCQ